jgi:hypothetical protein
MSLIELKPLGRWTVNVATSSTTIMGTEARGTKAPQRMSSPPMTSMMIVAPAQKKREWHAHRVQDRDEVIRTAGQFGVAVFKKTVADDESKRHRKQTRRRRKRSKGQSTKCGSEPHSHCFDVNASFVTFFGH